MSKNIKRIQYKKSDYNRILLTEVLPYELPIFFSNDSFYSRITEGSADKLDFEIQKNFLKNEKYTLPYNYEIIKGDTSARLLSVMHPATQLRFVPLYKKYDSLFVHLCSRSSYSIRKPVRVAKHYFEKSAGKRFQRSKTDVELAGDGFERQPATASSYFAYGDFNMAFRFFDSRRFHELEKRYRYFRSLDVSKCFYHIYTHTISWAVKEKEYAKANVQGSSFENDLDKLMQHSNYNETNGIIVGPETSRLFAEIIFQKVDLDLEQELAQISKFYGKDYHICRYVDDYYVFSNNKEFLDDIERLLSLQLAKIKLYFNEKKTVDLTRPFTTQQKLAKIEAARIVDRLFDGLTESIPRADCYPAETPSGEASKPEEAMATEVAGKTPTKPHKAGDGNISFPKYLKYPDAVAANYIRDLKLAVTSHETTFEYIASYFHSGLLRRLKMMLSRIDVPKLTAQKSERLWKFISQLVNIYLFVFAMSPRVRSTYQLSEFVLLIASTIKEMPRDNAEYTKKYIFDEICGVIDALTIPGRPKVVEVSNLLVILESLGQGYRLSEAKILRIFDIQIVDGKLENCSQRKDPLSYFEIVALLRYAGNDSAFDSLKNALANFLLRYFSSFKMKKYALFCQKTENVLLAFDAIRCPFFSEPTKLALARSVIEMNHSNDIAPRTKELRDTINIGDWFYRWDGILDLRTVLQKKELRSAY